MDDSRTPGNPIEDLLAETGMLDDDGLRTLLSEVHAEGTAAQPLPSHVVSRLMRRRPRRRVRGRYVVAVVVGATVLAGGAAAASPLSPISGSATAIVSGLLGGPGAGEPVPVSSDPPGGHPQQRGGGVVDPAPGIPDEPGQSTTHPTPAPHGSPRPPEPHPAHSHPAAPSPSPSPRSTHAGGAHH